jgi:hypothetical protein
VAVNVASRTAGLVISILLNPSLAGGKDEIDFERTHPPTGLVFATRRGNEQVARAGKEVSRESGCRAPTPGDFERVHEYIKHEKRPDGKAPYEILLEAWRAVLCKG